MLLFDISLMELQLFWIGKLSAEERSVGISECEKLWVSCEKIDYSFSLNSETIKTIVGIREKIWTFALQKPFCFFKK